MSEAEKLLNILTNSEWVCQNILTKIDESRFEKIHKTIFNAQDDAGGKWTDERKYIARGVKIGELTVGNELEDIFKDSIGWYDFTGHKLEPRAGVYILESGRLAIVGKATGSYDTGKSISAYGEYGTYVDKKVLILAGKEHRPFEGVFSVSADSMRIYAHDIANMLKRVMTESAQ